MISYHSNVVGLSYERRGDYIQQNVAPGSLLTLTPEPTNSYDPEAIAVFHGLEKIGYAPARSRWILQRLLAGDIQEIIAGNLEYDEFGLAAVLPIQIRAHEQPMRSTEPRLASPRAIASEASSEQEDPNLPAEVSVSPVIFRSRPIRFIIAIILIPVLIGIIILFFWWLESRTTTLEINRNSVRYETGIFSKDRRELGRGRIRTVRVQQSFLNRLLNVGTIEIYTAGDKPEIVASDMLEPNRLKQILTEG